MFKITAAEKRLLQRRRKLKAAYPGRFPKLLEEISVDDLVLAIEANEAGRDKETVVKVWREMMSNNMADANDTFRHELKTILRYLNSE